MYQRNKRKFDALSKKQVRGIRRIAKNVYHHNQEYKQHQVSSAPVEVYTGIVGVHFQHLTNMAQGINDTQRDGDEVNIKWLTLRIQLYNGIGVNANVNVNWRVLLFQYNANDNDPDLEEIFLSAAANGGTVPGTWSARNIDYLNLYNVLVDRVYHTEQGLNNALNYGTSGKLIVNKVIKLPMKYVKKKIQYQAASTTANNGIWLCVTTGQGDVTDNGQIIYTSAVGYTDS